MNAKSPIRPTLPTTMESPLPAATRARYPSWVLLDKNAYLDDGVNSTTAEAVTPAGDVVRVTFCLASPPFVSHFCLPGYNCSAQRQGHVVVSSAKDLILLRSGFNSYFVYQAAGNKPSSLKHIPTIHPGVSYPCIVPCDGHDDDGEFLIADLSSASAKGPGYYLLDVFSSKRPRPTSGSPSSCSGSGRRLLP
jgi:hypothetical protein